MMNVRGVELIVRQVFPVHISYSGKNLLENASGHALMNSTLLPQVLDDVISL